MKKTKKKNPWRFAFLALTVWGIMKIFPGILANLMVLLFALKAKLSPDNSVSVGIIGGADGPTAIFVTTPSWVHYILPILAIVIGVVGYWKFKKTKE